MLYYNDSPVSIDHFPDGTILMKQEVSFSGVHRITWKFENNEELVALIYLVNHIRSKSDLPVTLVLPYVPNARQDRVKNPEDVFTLKWFAQTINALKFDNICITDPHSSVAEALFDHVFIKRADDFIRESLEIVLEESGGTPVLMFYPDEGAMKRYSGAVDMPYAFGIKKRDWKTGQISGLDVAGATYLIEGHNILIVDDICSRGGTFTHSARKLKELGADKIYLYVTHCENTILQGSVLTDGLIEKVFTTDSILTKTHEKIEVIT